jgi:4-azaleucine resistance transporter AzlC
MTFRHEFAEGLADIVPIVVAALPIGLLWGTLAAGKDLSTAEAAAMSLTVFAGAAQFIALEQWRDPVPWLLICVTVFVVNLRHVLMGASLGRHMGGIPRSLRAPLLFLMADENWALSERRALSRPLSLAYYLGLGLPMLAVWTLSSALGASVGATLGDPAAYGFDFAFSAMFIGILAGFWKGASTAMVLGVSALAATTVHAAVPGPWFIMAGGLAGVMVAAYLHREEDA